MLSNQIKRTIRLTLIFILGFGLVLVSLVGIPELLLATFEDPKEAFNVGLPAVLMGLLAILYFGSPSNKTAPAKLVEPDSALDIEPPTDIQSIDDANVIILRFGPHGHINGINPFTEQFLGYTNQSIVGHKLVGTLVPKTESTGRNLDELFRRLRLHPRKYPQLDCELITSHGSRVWVCWVIQPIFDEQNKLLEILSIGHNITERKSKERKLLLTASVFDYSIEGILITDPNGHILRVNKAFTQITGFSANSVAGKTLTIFSSGRHNNRFFDKLWESLKTNGLWQGEIWNRRQSGEMFPAWLNLSVVKNKTGATTHCIGLLTDITDKKLFEQRIQQLAFFDELTQLPNRVLFLDRLSQALVKANREKLLIPLLYINLNRFKAINDSLGHEQGDLLLKLVAERLKHCVRESDTIGRIGGDEFTIIVEPVNNQDEVVRIAARIAKSVVETMLRPYDLNGYEAFISANIGIVSYPQDGTNATELMKNADTTVTHAKQQGPNQYLFYESNMNATAMKRMQMATDLHKALEKGEFELHYQPTLDIKSGQINGAEALIRWQHSDMGTIYPLEFIPLAEETGLIIPLSEWIFAEAIRQAKEWHDAGISPFRIAINMSVHNLRSKELLTFIVRMIEEIGVAAESVALELTESIFMADLTDIKSVLTQLDEIGIQLLIDDFGTGYSSLSRLKELPAHTLKIDRSFVYDIPDNGNNKSLVKAMIAMAHSLNMKVIAEGIETKQQLEFLMGQGCDEVQGYLISRPIPAENFKKLIIGANQIFKPRLIN
ncbi:MAG: EAL domain-containing protein [Gammaproteobacteria bacterium]|nr:EAL domain-containing protein [Gammaproteobacteria bacterium]